MPAAPRTGPADRVTIACFTFMARVMEVREFDSVFTGLVGSAPNLAKAMTPERAAQFESALGKYRHQPDRFVPHHQFFNELLLTRTVESFDLYLLHILRLIYAERPELIIEAERFEQEFTKSDFTDREQFLADVAERKLLSFGYKGLAKLRAYFEKEIGIPLFTDEELFQEVLLASQVRNLIAHNDCRANDLFLKRTAGLPVAKEVTLGQRYVLTIEWIHTIGDALEAAVFSFDEAAIPQFKLPDFNRMSSFLFRG